MNIKNNIQSSSIILKSYVNLYAFIGLGISISSIFIASLFVAYQMTGTISMEGFVRAQMSNPAIWVLDLTPFLFAYWGQSFCYGLVNKAETILMLKTNEFLSKRGDLEQKLRYESQYDSLTGLPNSRLFSEQLTQSIQQLGKGNELAVIVLKINDFKSILSNFGNFNTNSVLKQYTQKLNEMLVEPFLLQATMGINLLGRMESDEFALLLPRLAKNLDLNELLNCIINASTVTFMIDGINVNIAATAGIALYPQHGEDEATLLDHVRIAVYHARKNAKSYMFYNSDMKEDLTTTRIAMAQLKKSIENNELEIHYQPAVEFTNGQIIGAEALVRFENATSGLISAEKFIPMVEGTNLIHQLSAFMLRNVIKQLATWHSEGHMLYASVNLSAKDAVNKELPAQIAKLLQEFKVEPRFLKLEFTERACLSDQAKSIEVFNQLAKLGVKISIDDFCSGYSSFIYLTYFPINEIKIEKSIVLNMAKDPKKAKIVEAIYKIAQTFELNVSADGIEDQTILKELKQFGYTYGQGFYFSRPVSINEFEILLKGD
ncbi:MAG: GGDEF domain-containing protein [Legionella sp.]|nr:MAG: GGDEF domain-containing protein [Legionella sp.]